MLSLEEADDALGALIEAQRSSKLRMRSGFPSMLKQKSLAGGRSVGRLYGKLRGRSVEGEREHEIQACMEHERDHESTRKGSNGTQSWSTHPRWDMAP